MNIFSNLVLAASLCAPSLSIAQQADVPDSLAYDGVYIEGDAGSIVKLTPLPNGIATKRAAWYSFASASQTCLYRDAANYIDGKSFFIVRGGWWSEFSENATVFEKEKLKSIFVKGPGNTVSTVSYIFLFDEFVGDLGGEFLVPTNKAAINGFDGNVECELLPLGYTDGGSDAVVLSSKWGLWPETNFLRATIDSTIARYDFINGPLAVAFHRDPFELPAHLVDVANQRGQKTGTTADVAFPACSDGCRVVGLLIETSDRVFAVLGSEKPY